MTQEQNNLSAPRGTFDISSDVEHLIDNTNEDMSKFREKVQHLMDNVAEVVGENQQLRHELARYKLAETRKPGGIEEVQQRSQMTEDALATALKQIDFLQKERGSLKMIHECSQRTIDNMEKELKNYRKQLQDSGDDKVINKYIQAIKMMEGRVDSQKNDIRAQAEMIQVLHDQKQRSGKQLLEMQAKLQEQEHQSAVNYENSMEIAALKQQVMDYEQRLHDAQQLLRESHKREEVAMAKVQEALNLSDSAAREKTDAERRSESYKVELAQLAKNMGVILEEEAKRVDNEVKVLRSKHREKLKQHKAEHIAKMQALVTRYTQLEKKYNEVLDQNEKLYAELQDTSQRLNDDKQKISELKIYETRVSEYIQHQRKINEEYKKARNDLTTKFQQEVRRLMDMNSELKAEITILKGENSRNHTI
ncbi:protein CROWDED NUCLEI 3 isoform X1 [Drosophila pseudoobscura]|uniref:Protein CROWDED NUCLEI 3 isoform X1 n=1 Tax=Drosophila pseudoobscura pseudoobscura TaxID=46245 RepID=A0A6I8VPY6_DROPS|nr:protein CROWDED NUCLEI 3 isoform X1 [Drosophila pseudoobscura]